MVTTAARRMRRAIRLCILLTFAGTSSAVTADEFTLKDGRKISGTLIKKNEDTLVVELSPGNMLLLAQAEIKVHQQNGKGEAAYVEALKTSVDTIESHLLMASVAHKNLMLDHERAHYERVIELEPDNAVARAALGFVRGKTVAG